MRTVGSGQEKATVCYHVGQQLLPGPGEVLRDHRVLLPDEPPNPVKGVTWAELYSEEWTAPTSGVGWDRGHRKAVGMALGG